MAKLREITATGRTDEGKGASRRLRRAGQVPAIVYGAGKDPQNIQLEHEQTLLLAKNEWFFSSILDLSVDGKKQKVLVRDWQVHPYRQQMLHLDFLRINEKEAIRINIPLHFLNQEESPAGKMANVVIYHNLTEVEVLCLPKDLPENITVDLAEIEEGGSIRLSELTLPEGVEIAALKLGAEYDQTVASAHKTRVEVEPEADVEDEGGEAAAPGEPTAGDDAAEGESK